MKVTSSGCGTAAGGLLRGVGKGGTALLGALSAFKPGVNTVPVGDDPQPVEQEFAADASGFVNHRQARPGVGATADEEQVLDFVELVLGTAPEHLVKPVGQVEHGAAVTVVAPIFGGDGHLGHDVIADAFKAQFFFDLVEDAFLVGILVFFPVDVLVNVGHGHQGVHR